MPTFRENPYQALNNYDLWVIPVGSPIDQIKPALRSRPLRARPHRDALTYLRRACQEVAASDAPVITPQPRSSAIYYPRKNTSTSQPGYTRLLVATKENWRHLGRRREDAIRAERQILGEDEFNQAVLALLDDTNANDTVWADLYQNAGTWDVVGCHAEIGIAPGNNYNWGLCWDAGSLAVWGGEDVAPTAMRNSHIGEARMTHLKFNSGILASHLAVRDCVAAADLITPGPMPEV